MKDFLRIFRYIKPYWKFSSLYVGFNTLSTLFALLSFTMFIPFLQVLFSAEKIVYASAELKLSAQGIIDYFNYILSRLIYDKGPIYGLMLVSAILIIATVLKTFLSYLGSFYIQPVTNGIVRDFQKKLYKKIIELPLRFFTEERKGDLLARVSSDTVEIKASVAQSVNIIFRDPIMIIFYLSYLFYSNYQITIAAIVIIPFVGYIIGKIGKSLKKTSARGQKIVGELLSIVEETISGLRIIKAFNAEKRQFQRFHKMNETHFKIMKRIGRKRSLSAPLSEFLGTLVVVVILWFGGTMVLGENSTFSSEELITYLIVFSQILTPAKEISRAYYDIQKGIASVDRIEAILNATDEIVEKPDAKAVNSFNDCIEFKNVSFKYENDYVLKNISLKIEKGKTIALVGESGSGKSTLVDLIPRFYDIDEGDILFDGVNIKELKIKDLRNLIGNVNQIPILFNDTIANNIAFGVDTIDMEEIVNSSKIANAHEFIIEKPEKYESNIGDSGSKLSGGQRQRLSIARAVLKNPPIMILDEATSSLDTESEKIVQDALNKLMKNRTSIVIAHRLSTVKNADEIIVLYHGEIIERGRHDELINKNGIYRKLCELQMV